MRGDGSLKLNRLSQAKHPRLMVLIIAGCILIGLAGLLLVLESFLSIRLLPLSVRVGIIGFLLAIFGIAGYIAIGVFEQRPET